MRVVCALLVLAAAAAAQTNPPYPVIGVLAQPVDGLSGNVLDTATSKFLPSLLQARPTAMLLVATLPPATSSTSRAPVPALCQSCGMHRKRFGKNAETASSHDFHMNFPSLLPSLLYFFFLSSYQIGAGNDIPGTQRAAVPRRRPRPEGLQLAIPGGCPVPLQPCAGSQRKGRLLSSLGNEPFLKKK